MTQAPTPKVGDIIYIGPSDFRWGGKAVVDRIVERMNVGNLTPFVSVEQSPGCEINWVYLSEKQDKLKEQYGDSWATPNHQTELCHYSLRELREEIERREKLEKKEKLNV